MTKYFLVYTIDTSGEFDRIIPIAIFGTELDALRFIVNRGYGQLSEREFGEL